MDSVTLNDRIQSDVILYVNAVRRRTELSRMTFPVYHELVSSPPSALIDVKCEFYRSYVMT